MEVGCRHGSIDSIVGFSDPIVYLPDLLVGLPIQLSTLYFCQIRRLNSVRSAITTFPVYVSASNLLSSFAVFKVMTILSALVGWAAPNLWIKHMASQGRSPTLSIFSKMETCKAQYKK
ncbi:uncharacterized protein LOC120089304 [Benincasa hispida]|uniref:uncharacterized protein LOC120089304 n=1 Tax=Benincasa hispida TaxID=102211 RepID=UPI001902038B|nr:uncharacterized protein LOC120089304 [Benincasa hispida]